MSKDILSPVSGVPEGIGYYLAGMREVREQLKKAVADLTDEECSARVRPDARTIGELLLHCGEAEWWWIQIVTNGGKIDEELEKSAFWDPFEEDEFPDVSHSVSFCMDEIERVSAKTKEVLSDYSDGDLDKLYERPYSKEKKEYSLRWILHHLTDHEAQHKGQIFMLKRMMRG